MYLIHEESNRASEGVALLCGDTCAGRWLFLTTESPHRSAGTLLCSSTHLPHLLASSTGSLLNMEAMFRNYNLRPSATIQPLSGTNSQPDDAAAPFEPEAHVMPAPLSSALLGENYMQGPGSSTKTHSPL